MVAGLVLLGGPAWAQEDPCAPGTDGSVLEMCQGGAALEPAPEGEPIDPCEGSQPVEPGDGVITDGDQSEGIAEGEPNPDTPTDDTADSSGETKPEPDSTEPAPAPDEEPLPAEEPPTMIAPLPGNGEDDVVVCAFAGAPVSAPVDSSAGGGQAAAPVLESASGQNAATALGQLPRTGPYDALIALAGAGAALLLAGAAAAAAGRRRVHQA